MCTTGEVAFSTYRGLRRSDWTRADIERACSAGALVRVRRGIYATAESCADATAAVAHGGALHCISAARHEGLWVLADADRVHVGLRAGDHQYPHEKRCGCLVHWDDRTAGDSFGLPSIPRILRQILRCCGVEDFFVALESAMHLRRIGPAGLEWLGANTNDVGRTAIRLAQWDADSGLESLVRWRLREYRLPVRTQVSIASVGAVDLLIGERLIIEADGKDNHDDESHRHQDLLRDANAAANGYVTLRFDYALIVHDWPRVERAILGQLAVGHHL